MPLKVYMMFSVKFILFVLCECKAIFICANLHIILLL
jgi:hypothetical protein